MTDHGLAGSQHFIFNPGGEGGHYEMAGVSLRPGAYELIEQQLLQIKRADDESVAVRYLYQLEGVLLTLLRYEDISELSADRLRKFIYGTLPAGLMKIHSIP
ncbi:hypothetical protein [Pseudomonas extremorientalis]|uniref:Uncharacterized protein n=1 Tax=Pseudomonas extremorientalis TaxID=169669 RepID=A0A1H0KRU3_9PSED|nr:hypothetical protein [Pseudomonas extremorientalis]KAB0517573.1 hypothetical protein F7R08_18315 [Pseudomonas extremorientalis]OIN05003.1 hypothetical protein BFN10_24115 [Pseudomonas extremorientalis]SDO58677.1 hypothetical protein SAMN04490184_0924 [Pseudomonas extremorientalis]